MRRTLHFLVVVALTLTCSIGVTAYASAPARTATYAKQGEAATVVPSRCNPLGKDVKPQSGLKDVPADARKSFKTRKVARAITVDQLVGKYAIHYKSLSTSYCEGGGSVYITKKSADSITVHDFFYQGITFTAHVDVDHGTFDIPVQVIGTNESYGDVALCKMNTDGSPNYKTPITGTITSDGSLDIDGWWGIYVTSGTYVNRYIYPGYATTIDKANGTMKVRRVYVSDSDTVDERWNVVLKQKSANLVTVQNFGNHGLTLEVVLGSDGTATVDKQVALYESSEYGNFYPVMVDDWSKEKYTFSSPLVGRATQDSINFGNWTLASDLGFFDNKLLYGYITGIKFVLPEPASSSLQGSGTESDPYLVNSLADLIYVSQSANGTAGKAFAGKYLKQTADIDASNFRFSPIGYDGTHSFAGNYDGQGHTISGLNVSQSWGYAGLFGNADTASVVKNINLTGASVNSMNSCVGIAAGFSAGTLQGISVEGTVLNSGRFTGGMAGIARNVEGCSAIVTVEGDNGTTGGLVGQLTGNLSKSHAQAIVYSSQANVGNPAGGLVALVRATDSISAPVISDSYATGTVYAHYNSGQYVGGLVGSMFYGTVQRCFANTSVTCGNNDAVAGGLVGASIAAQIKDCYSTGTVYSFGTPAPHTGGITGLMSYLTVKNGYATDTIRGSMENCITTCRLAVEVDAYDNAHQMREIYGVIDAGTNPVIKNCYFDRQMENLGSVHGRALTTFLTSGKALPGYSTDVWTFTQGVYPRLKGMEDTPEAQLAASAIHFDTTVPDGVDYISKTATISTLGTTELYVVKGERDYSKTGSVCRIDGNKILLTGGMGADTLAFRDAKNPNVEPRLYAVKAAPASFTGEGTEANPFLITNKADLVKLSQLTSNYQQPFADVYFKQTADIDLQLDTAFHGIAAYNDAYYNSSVHKFCGTYDGDGHTIHKMKLAWIDWNVAPGQVHFGTPNTSGPHIAKDKGFIGVLGQGGVLKNLNIASDCQIELWSYSGALVGDNHGLVENCRNYADVTGYDQSIGGLVGESRIGSIIRNCFNAGNVKAASVNVAGIASKISGTVIENCANTGNVVADTLTILHTNTSGAAGLVNYMAGSSITNCLNAGHVFAHTSASGIVNSAASSLVVNSMRNDIKGVLNYGTVFADSAQENTIAAFASSDINASAQVSGNYFDAQLTGLTALNRNTVREGVTAAKTATLTSGKPLAGLSDSVYVYNAGMYPMLKKFADEPTAVKAAKLIVYVAGGRTTRTICGNSMLSNAEGTTWKLERGNYFGISGDTLTLSGTLTVKRNDVLTGTLDGYSRPVKLTAMPALALDGTGSEDDPYLIKNRTDWNNVSKYMTRWDYTFNGEWLRVANDFTLATGTMREWGNAGAVPFAGTLDGAGHTISGIHYEPTQTFSGIINVLSEGGVIRDLTLQGHATLEHQQSGVWTGRAYGSFINCHNKVALTSKAVNTANFAGYCTGTVRFEGCTNDTTLTATKQSVAGFVGLLSADGATFTDCQNNGDITCTASVNELAGIAVGDATATYVRCGNNGNITSAGRCVAGLQANIEAKTLPLVAVDCYNTGNITATAGVAGLFGQTDNYSPVVASGCYNTGTITATGSSTVFSGAAGLFLRLGTESQLTDCYNAGTVTAGAANYVAGLWAGTYTYTEKPASIERCYNTAAISGKNHVAGLGGHAGWITNVTNCYNTGTVVAAGYGAAGLVAESGKDAVISNSWNAASVTAADSLAGGILGATDAGHVTIADCFNAGSVTAPAITDGVAGEGNLTLTGCYNAGDVTGTTQAAGLVGQPHIATAYIAGTTITGCYNSGRVQTTASGATAVGALVANHDAAHWDASCNIAGSCYVTDFNGTLPADAVGGTAVTVKQLAAADGDQSALAGDGWNYGDSYTYPMIASIGDNDCAKANAAAVVVNDGDSYDHVTGTFWVGLPEGATWSFNSDAIDLKGNNAYVTRACNDTVLATVTCGNYSRTWKLKLDVTSGVDANLAQKPIVSRTYYNVAGQQSEVPFPGINIVVTRYSDGTTTSRKVVK